MTHQVSKLGAATPRTSATHPLQIAEVRLDGGGVLGLTFCPGKHQADALTGAWARNLATDLDAIATWGAAAVLTLMEGHELEALQVTALGDACGLRAMAWLHLPFPDGGVPDAAFEARWWVARPWLWRHLDRDGKLLIHCKGGLGRTGLLAARILLERKFEAARSRPVSAEAAPYAVDPVIAALRAVRPGAVETEGQRRWLLDHLVTWTGDRGHSATEASDLTERLCACLVGGGCGDALGAPVEFLSDAEITARFGPRGVRDYVAGAAAAGTITDDTQMTLFTAEGMLRGYIRGTLKGTCHWPSVVHHALLRWLYTQQGHWQLDHEPDGFLMTFEGLRVQRAPGNTCLSALRAAKSFGDAPTNDSKGCGGVMRVAPVAAYCVGKQAFKIGADCARLTHGHPSGYLPAGWLAVCLADLSRGRRLTDAMAAADRELAAFSDPDADPQKVSETAAALALARREAAATVAAGAWPQRIPSRLGGGWVGEEALAIAVYCALIAEAWHDRAVAAVQVFEDAVSLAVSHGGDSDSTGSLTGQLLGARFGGDALPKRWVSALEFADEIQYMGWLMAGTAEGHILAEELVGDHPGW